MRKFLRWPICLVCLPFTMAQGQSFFRTTKVDSTRLAYLKEKIGFFFFLNPDSTVDYAEALIKLTEAVPEDPDHILALQLAGEGYRGLGEYPKSLELQLRALRLSRTNGYDYQEGVSASFVGFTYLQAGFYKQALSYLLHARKSLDSSADKIHASFNASNTAFCYTKLGILDSARIYNAASQQLFQLGDSLDDRRKALRTLLAYRFGNMYELAQARDSALNAYRLCVDFATRDSILVNVGHGNMLIAGLYLNEERYDSAIHYARIGLVNSQRARIRPNIVATSEILAAAFRQQGSPDSALKYLSISVVEKDSISGPEKFRELQVLMAEEQDHQQEQEIERIEEKNTFRLVMMGLGIAFFAGLVLILRRNNVVKQSLNRKLSEQRDNLEKTLETLRSTQSQLIQSEKMASLGELTAGIAHEIQNPLNFVNNFSDLNQELIEDLNQELDKGDVREAKVIAENLKENESKINLHGKRADGIVKSMLQHSRSSSGQKELKDVNKLVEEYTRLAYHGFRARNKDFNVALDLDLHPDAGSAQMVAQDIGRVVLNLLNNAFQAVQEKAKTAEADYRAAVSISTRRLASAKDRIDEAGLHNRESVIITVEDNGPGIAENIREKIFQPFFTTKPTGQGTGLGLSLSYDIVTKGHGGTLQAGKTDEEGASFSIVLPV